MTFFSLSSKQSFYPQYTFFSPENYKGKKGGTHFLFPLNKKNKKRVLKEKTLLILKKYEVFLKNGLFSSKLYGIHAPV